MATAETMVIAGFARSERIERSSLFQRKRSDISCLRDFKEQANRDRFVLPETKDVSFFVDTIDQCVEFLN